MDHMQTSIEATKEVIDSIAALFGEQAAAAAECAINSMSTSASLLAAASNTLDARNMERLAEACDKNISNSLHLACLVMPRDKYAELAALIATSGSRLIKSQIKFINEG